MQYSFSTGPFKNLSSPGPATTEEFDAAAGQGEALKGAMADAIYRGHLPTLHEKFVLAVQAITGNAPKVDDKRTAAAKARAKESVAVADVLETAVTYLDREVEFASPEQKTAIEKAVRDIASATFIDVSPSVRQGSAKKAYIERAQQVLGRSIDEIEKYVSTVLTLDANAVIDRDTDNKPTLDSLARAVQKISEDAARKAAEALG